MTFRFFLTIILFIILICAGVLLYFWGTSAPALTITPGSGPLSGMRKVTLRIIPPAGGLKNLKITARQGDTTVPVLEKVYPATHNQTEESFTLGRPGLKDGPLTLQIRANGLMKFNFPSRTAQQEISYSYDNTPPMVAVLSTAHNIIRGGSGLVVYTVNKEVERSGVVAGNRFYPGYRQSGENYACLFPFPYNAEPDRYVPRIVAVDKAGNERLAGINYHLIAKNFSSDRINLTESFLEKVSSEFRNLLPPPATPLEIFLKANGDVRRQNLKSINEHGRQTSPTPLWQGIFLRMPNAAPLGGFAQTRFYIYNGQQVDQQTHLGFDLASVIHAPVPAANNGKVVFAGDMGIYGQCVIIDHGLGLQTLYGHLSRLLVKAGDIVEKGEIIGNSGATGMAAGDHLHYGVVVGGEEVNPVEWWDASWIKNNITGKLDLVTKTGAK